MMFEIILMLVVGVAAGTLSGLFGLGGGVVVVPILYVFLTHVGAPENIVMHLAVGTSLAAMITTTFNSIWLHHRKKNINWVLARRLFIYVAIGALVGGIASRFISANVLKYVFAVFLMYVIWSALFKKKFTEHYKDEDFNLPQNWTTRIVLAAVGFVSVLLGVGGSLFSVPFFRKYHCPMKRASGLALALTPAVSIVGSVSYLIMGFTTQIIFPHTWGYIYWPAFLGIGLGSLLGVPLGVYLSHNTPDRYQAKLYVVLVFIFLLMILY